jgi:hypothetical protein
MRQIRKRCRRRKQKKKRESDGEVIENSVNRTINYSLK